MQNTIDKGYPQTTREGSSYLPSITCVGKMLAGSSGSKN